MQTKYFSRFGRMNNIMRNFSTGPLKMINPTKFAGKLTILPTPIGNLQDLSPNIIKALFKADIIGCQDRRVAGKLYTLIKSKNIMENVVQDFGQIGLRSIIPLLNQQNKQKTQQQQNYLFYQYSNMNQKARKKMLRKMTKQDQQKFKIDYLKYRALKIMQREDQFLRKQKDDKFDELYGLDSSDLEHIELQIRNTRMKKGRGVLIPLNTYSQTKMFSMVKMFLQTKNVAIISDAGMPCISDPGWKMVRKIRQAHPQLPIQVIGGPSTVSLMTLLASLSTKQDSNSISGRFQGFAPEQTSQMTENTVDIQEAKRKQFSIHFINSKKLRNKALQLEKVYGSEQKIILANELTKLYERKYHGNLGQLNSQMSKEDSQFAGIGQLSYLVYPNTKNKSTKAVQQIQSQDINNSGRQKQNKVIKEVPLSRLNLISIENFINSIKDAEQQLQLQKNQNSQIQQKKQNHKKGNSSQISSKDMVDLICSTFGIKTSEARKLVYQKQIAIKKKTLGLPENNFDTIKIYKEQVQKQNKSQNQNQNESQSQKTEQKTNRRVGRRTQRKKQQQFSEQQLQLLKMLEKQKGNFF